MDRILIISGRQAMRDLRPLLAARGYEVIVLDSVDAALKATAGVPVAVAIVSAPMGELVFAVQKLIASRPEVQVLAASDLEVPRPVLLALWAGAAGVIDAKVQSPNEIVLRVQEAIGRHRQTTYERSLLLRLHGLNEDFLRNMVAVEKRNIELEERLQPEASLDAAWDEGPRRVLIVDDEDVVAAVLKATLAPCGYEVAIAPEASAALELLRLRLFHLVITDKNLPGMGGLELIREVKARWPDTEAMMITGYASKETAIEALNSGASAYLEKPFEHVGQVRAKVESVIAKQAERIRRRRYLSTIKERNRAFLDQYRAVRADLEAWLQNRGPAPAGASPDAVPSEQQAAQGEPKPAKT